MERGEILTLDQLGINIKGTIEINTGVLIDLVKRSTLVISDLSTERVTSTDIYLPISKSVEMRTSEKNWEIYAYICLGHIIPYLISNPGLAADIFKATDSGGILNVLNNYYPETYPFTTGVVKYDPTPKFESAIKVARKSWDVSITPGSKIIDEKIILGIQSALTPNRRPTYYKANYFYKNFYQDSGLLHVLLWFSQQTSKEGFNYTQSGGYNGEGSPAHLKLR